MVGQTDRGVNLRPTADLDDQGVDNNRLLTKIRNPAPSHPRALDRRSQIVVAGDGVHAGGAQARVTQDALDFAQVGTALCSPWVLVGLWTIDHAILPYARLYIFVRSDTERFVEVSP